MKCSELQHRLKTGITPSVIDAINVNFSYLKDLKSKIESGNNFSYPVAIFGTDSTFEFDIIRIDCVGHLNGYSLKLQLRNSIPSSLILNKEKEKLKLYNKDRRFIIDFVPVGSIQFVDHLATVWFRFEEQV